MGCASRLRGKKKHKKSKISSFIPHLGDVFRECLCYRLATLREKTSLPPHFAQGMGREKRLGKRSAITQGGGEQRRKKRGIQWIIRVQDCRNCRSSRGVRAKAMVCAPGSARQWGARDANIRFREQVRHDYSPPAGLGTMTGGLGRQRFRPVGNPVRGYLFAFEP